MAFSFLLLEAETSTPPIRPDSAKDYPLPRSDFCSLKTLQCHHLVPHKFLPGDSRTSCFWKTKIHGILLKCSPYFLWLSLKTKTSRLRSQPGHSWFRMVEILCLTLSSHLGSYWRHTLNELKPQCLSAQAHTAEALPAALRREPNGRACAFRLRRLPAPAFSHRRGSEGGAELRARPQSCEPGRDGGRARAGSLQAERAMLHGLPCAGRDAWRPDSREIRGRPFSHQPGTYVPSSTSPKLSRTPTPGSQPRGRAPSSPPSPFRTPHGPALTMIAAG